MYLVALIGLGTVIAAAYFTTPYMAVATSAYALFCVGLSIRRRHRERHMVLMSLAMLIDVLLVLVLQWQRSAIQTAVGFTLTPLQQTHIYCSVAALLLYGPVVFCGVSLYLRPAGRLRRLHRRLGWLTFWLRTLSFITMFSLLNR